jgi:DNA-binding Lrp family transcriptional regulator
VQNIKKDVLELLEKDSRLTNDQLAKLLNVSAEEIKEIIEQLERDNIILRYSTIINWEKHGCQKVTAMIEVNITPQREVGFDKIAERIYRFPQVKSVYLVSGSYDLCVIIEDDTMQGVSRFVTIIGPNGSGKSTLLKTLSKLILPDKGSILLDNTNLLKLKPLELARQMAVVPQTFAIDFPFNVLETVLMGQCHDDREYSMMCDDESEYAGMCHSATMQVNIPGCAAVT